MRPLAKSSLTLLGIIGTAPMTSKTAWEAMKRNGSTLSHRSVQIYCARLKTRKDLDAIKGESKTKGDPYTYFITDQGRKELDKAIFVPSRVFGAESDDVVQSAVKSAANSVWDMCK
jgi:hypothetical protein